MRGSVSVGLGEVALALSLALVVLFFLPRNSTFNGPNDKNGGFQGGNWELI